MTSPTSLSPEIAFISGPLDTGPNDSYFHTYYVPQINTAIDRGHHFVIGPVTGVDRVALEYLLAYPVPPSHITIFVTPTEDYLLGDEFRSFKVNVQVVGGGPNVTTQERDAAMTRASSYDILRWRTRREARKFYGVMYREGYVTNTERNWRRRKGISETAVVREEDVDIFLNEKRSYGTRVVGGLSGLLSITTRSSRE
ncbi:hypothetical protein ETB97_002726 [Aspergillus alliaceus]|uniref:Uncharacterized protein n=1 Tax=Petromyces alliaceus TaxID=209559 RepID=A0A5N6FIS8_PETAA|nr:uncharacterized protein BDW43DRAFT_175443 [Aspergillus alliaceus]KAB8229841.1 hypothetical protein BDW43DRAFT_175443 [Aspergillus alliaceus]KAF5859551.1 hypothetical protein ETB97_002726 [Aspergillus burnettii]